MSLIQEALKRKREEGEPGKTPAAAEAAPQEQAPATASTPAQPEQQTTPTPSPAPASTPAPVPAPKAASQQEPEPVKPWIMLTGVVGIAGIVLFALVLIVVVIIKSLGGGDEAELAAPAPTPTPVPVAAEAVAVQAAPQAAQPDEAPGEASVTVTETASARAPDVAAEEPGSDVTRMQAAVERSPTKSEKASTAPVQPADTTIEISMNRGSASAKPAAEVQREASGGVDQVRESADATVAETPPAKQVIWPELTITGVMARPNSAKSSAIINADIVATGENYQGVKVVKILQNGVHLEFDGEKKFVRVGHRTR